MTYDIIRRELNILFCILMFILAMASIFACALTIDQFLESKKANEFCIEKGYDCMWEEEFNKFCYKTEGDIIHERPIRLFKGEFYFTEEESKK